jgi:PAS domain S-box-containing protein
MTFIIVLKAVNLYFYSLHFFNFAMKKKLQQNMEGKESIDALFLYASEGILVVNESGYFVKVNPSAEKLFGYDHNELIGKKIEVLVPQNVSKIHQAHREKFNQNPSPRTMASGRDLFGLKKDGTEFSIEISLSPYTSHGENFVIAFIIDITARKYAEEKLQNYSFDLEKQVKNRTLILEEAIQELEKTKKELNKALNKEKELNTLKSRFVSMASHEFRTPLTTMMSSLSLVTKYGEQNDTENQLKHVGKIKNSIHNLTDILNDFLHVGKLEEMKIENMVEPLQLKQYFTEIIAEMQLTAKGNQKITLDYAGNELAQLDKKLLKHILFNLISNGLKFTNPEDGLITISIHVQTSSVKITVKDNGIGILKEDQERLFERFFRGYNATHIQGTGLGLNIVSKYVELMEGTIHFNSEENIGTTFTIIIPQ